MPKKKLNPSQKPGRPKLKVDWKRVDELAEAGCPGTEIAAHLGLKDQIFYDKVQQEKGMYWSEYLQQKSAKGNASIRELQYLKALGKKKFGDNMMLIWLGKNRLDQRDRPKDEEEVPNDKQLDNLIDSLKSKK